MKLRMSQESVSRSIAENNMKCAAADEVERNAVADALSRFDSWADDQTVVLSSFAVGLKTGSSLQVIQKPLTQRLVNILLLFSANRPAVLRSNGDFLYTSKEGVSTKPQQYFDDLLAGSLLNELVEEAKNTGGEIHSVERASCAQWLKFHGFEVPGTVEGVKELRRFLTWQWPVTDDMGNYWGQIEGWDQSVELSLDECNEIRGLTKKYYSGGERLLDVLYANVKPELADRVGWENADEVISVLVKHPFSQNLAMRYTSDLGWWGAGEKESVDETDLAQLLITAILLQLDGDIGKSKSFNSFESFNIYEPRDTVDKALYDVRNVFEKHLIESGKASRLLAPIASHLILASTAPSLLVKKIPAGVFTGSIGWVVFCQAVNLIELNFKGMTRFMTYEQIMDFFNLSAVCPALEQLKGVASIDAVLDWGLVNEVISRDALEK